MGRSVDNHLDSKEFAALVPGAAAEPHGLSADIVRNAELHIKSCQACRRKVAKYAQLVGGLSPAVTGSVAAGPQCPRDEDVDWFEVAAGLWPELKARQLIMHAALCEHCGPRLRAAASVNLDATPEEDEFLARLKAPSRPEPIILPGPSASKRWALARWLVPALALLVIVTALFTLRRAPALSGSKYAEFAVSTHRQYAQGGLPLEVRSDSQQSINDWLKANSPFALALPASPPAPGEERPFRLQGARLVSIANRKTAAFIAYQMEAGPASLVVAPDTVAAASGGVKAEFKKVTFHYRTVAGYKVVTWTLSGKTYALVSQEGNASQSSCMICHSAMRDRDLSHTSTPLRSQTVFQ